MIHLFASDGRTLLDALDDGEAFRRQQARDCPCSDEMEPGSCENCELHLNAADEYADLAGVIARRLSLRAGWRAGPDAAEPALHDRPGNPNFGRGIEEVPIRGGLL